MFHIGDSVFVYPSIFREDVLVHIRRFQKYGNKFYPTKEGVTLLPAWMDSLMQRGKVPEKSGDLCLGNSLFPVDIKIESMDFENFTFSRIGTTHISESLQKTITITSSQWRKMLEMYDDIAAIILDNIFGSMDFLSAYMSFEDRDIEECLPDSLDVSLGIECLLEHLKNSVSDCIKESGCLKDPQSLAEELWGNRVQTFNSVALHVKVSEIADTFYSRIWEYRDFLSLSRPANYITRTFLMNIRLQDILKEVRNTLCPPNVFEFFEDFE